MRIALLGGGLDILVLPSALRSHCESVDCYLAPRHALEVYDGKTLKELLDESHITNFVVKDDFVFQSLIQNKGYDLVFGLGPAWIISKKTLSLASNWVNINPIPIPKYLGGAHSTWQVLHQDNHGSIVFQEIGFPVDRGKIIARFDFMYSSEQSDTESRLNENSKQLKQIISEAVTKILEQPDNSKINQGYEDREYWPRLNTGAQGWIDWSWTALEIVRFIQAFGRPFLGAHSELLGEVVYFEEAVLLEHRELHPFSAGIIIRSISQYSLDVAVKDGFLRVKVKLPQNLTHQYLEGLRLHTPIEKLELAKKISVRTKDL